MQKKEETLVSVIMPAYNAASYIREAIDSVLHQSYTNFELVVVDDGSTDTTGQIVQSYADKRLRYFALEKNCGRGYARNFAIDNCKGELIAICDADDINLPDRLLEQVRFLEENNDVDVVGAQLLHFSEKSKPAQLYRFPQTPRGVACFFQKGIMGVPHASCMLRKKCFENRRYENAISYNVEDFELFLQLSKFHKMASLPKALVLYRNELSETTLERIKHHELYHHYAVYSAAAKLKNETVTSFDDWARIYKKSWRHKRRSGVTFLKIRIKTALRHLSR